MSTFPTESVLLAVMPKVPALLSILGSMAILQHVVRNPKSNNVHGRIMFGLSLCDILASAAYFAGTWAIPTGTLSSFGDMETEKIFWATGNNTTCNIAGFFNQFAVATPLYSATLALYFFQKICYERKKFEKTQWIFHIIPIGYATITSIIAACFDMYGHVDWTCWIVPRSIRDSSITPTAAQNKFKYFHWFFLFGPVWICIAWVTFVMIMLYKKMKEGDKAVAKYRHVKTTPTNKNNPNEGIKNIGIELASKETKKKHISSKKKITHEKASRRVAIQGMLYVCAFYVTWLFPTVTRFMEMAGKQMFAIQILDTSLLPLQGLFNFIIYMRPKANDYRVQNPDTGFWRALWTVVVFNGGNRQATRSTVMGRFSMGLPFWHQPTESLG